MSKWHKGYNGLRRQMKWKLARIRREDGTYESIRIRRSSLVTAGEVADQKAWRAARKAVTA